jgi:hypothetical protein
LIIFWPAFSALKERISINCPQPASAILLFNPDLADWPFGRKLPPSLSCFGLARLHKFLTFKSSTKITSAFSRTFLEVSKWNCFLCLAIFWCSLAKYRTKNVGSREKEKNWVEKD